MSTVYKSVYSNQDEILQAIRDLHGVDQIDADITYGNGAFYKNIPEPKNKFDIDPQSPSVIEACSTCLPVKDSAFKSVVFDPPFLTYVRAGRGGNGNMVMSKRFSGYWRYDELADHYQRTISEVRRVLSKNGVLIFKCQDIIHNHKMHCTHRHVIEWCEAAGMRLIDLFILAAAHRMPSPNRRGKQRHARIFHSYFLVFKLVDGK